MNLSKSAPQPPGAFDVVRSIRMTFTSLWRGPWKTAIIVGFVLSLAYHLTVVPYLWSKNYGSNPIFPPSIIAVFPGVLVGGTAAIMIIPWCDQRTQNSSLCKTATDSVESRNVSRACLTETQTAREQKNPDAEGMYQRCLAKDPASAACIDSNEKMDRCFKPVTNVLTFGVSFIAFWMVFSLLASSVVLARSKKRES